MRSSRTALLCAALSVAALAWAQGVSVRPGEYELDNTARVAGEDAPVTSKDTMCVTAADARDFQKLVIRQVREFDEDCTLSNVKTSSGRLTFEMRCAHGSPQRVTFDVKHGPDWFEIASTWTDEEMTVHSHSRAKWLRAACTTPAGQ